MKSISIEEWMHRVRQHTPMTCASIGEYRVKCSECPFGRTTGNRECTLDEEGSAPEITAKLYDKYNAMMKIRDLL